VGAELAEVAKAAENLEMAGNLGEEPRDPDEEEFVR